jgi:hypothetical protein
MYSEDGQEEFEDLRGLLLRSSRTKLEEQFALQEAVFSHVVSCDEIAPQENMLLREIQG